MLYLIFALAIILVQSQVNKISDFTTWAESFSITILLDLVMFTIIANINRIRVFSLPFLFCLFSYLFNFGEVFLFGVVNQKFDYQNHLKMYPLTIVQPATILCYIIHASVICGILFSRLNYYSPDINLSYTEPKNIGFCKLICTVCMFLCLPIETVLDVLKIYMLNTGGYEATYTIVGMDGLSAIGSFYIIGFVLCLYLCKKENTTKVLFLEILYLVFIMLSGDRAKPATNICVLLYFYKIIRNKKWRVKIVVYSTGVCRNNNSCCDFTF